MDLDHFSPSDWKLVGLIERRLERAAVRMLCRARLGFPDAREIEMVNWLNSRFPVECSVAYYRVMDTCREGD